MVPKDFQKATAEHILSLYKNGQKRVLLADEVGLGKTIIAKAVVDLVAEWHRSDEIQDDHFKVVYICSNISISRQNAKRLDIKDTLNVSECRLSMQHLFINEKARLEHEYKQLIPLTPTTSFSMSRGTGTQEERALMYVHLKRLPQLHSIEKELYELMKMMEWNARNWDYFVNQYQIRADKCNENGSNYYQNIGSKLAALILPEDIQSIINYCTINYSKRHSIEAKYLLNRLRRIFAQISLEELEPDLVIMDEFQRFKSLIIFSEDSEQTMLMKKFLSSDNTKVLLLSATPYKPFTTIEELNETNNDEQYQDFIQLMDFLYEKQTEEISFSTVWNDYATSLVRLDSSSLSTLIASKNTAEDRLYNVMCRTERFNTGIINDEKARPVDITPGDIQVYCQMNDLMRVFEKRISKSLRGKTRLLPMEYVKSCPYPLSFMDNYQLKKDILEAFYHSGEDPKKYVSTHAQKYILVSNRIYNYQNIESANGKLKALKHILFTNASEKLLWVPASKPYYKVKGSIFEKNKDFSKVLVFSAWEMVPRMLAILLSYESERLTVPKAFGDAKYNKKIKGRLNDENKDALLYPCKYLSELYNPAKYYDCDIEDIRVDIGLQIASKIEEIKTTYAIEKYSLAKAKASLSVMKLLDGNAVEEMSLAENQVEILTDIAIASPAVVLARQFKDSSYVANIAKEFVALFNNKEAMAILDLMYPKQDYFEKVLKYCVEGNLQAVMDEYYHILEDHTDEQLSSSLLASFPETTPTLDIDTTDSFYSKGERKRFSMRMNYALRYGNVKLTEKDVKRSVSIQSVFNSPFRPFVLATTSIGQEGLDFHLYSRKIVHWNLPSNPVDLEQREGRINRYKCLAVRRNVANRYPAIYSWNELFDAAKAEFKGNYSEMVPYWCLPPEMKTAMETDGQKFEQIERIIPWYPLSIDRSKYEHLIKVLSLYRLTMGQPRQEELLALLQERLSPEEINKLLIDLSPSSYKHLKNTQ